MPVGILRKHGKGHEGVIPVLLDVIEKPSEGMFSPTGGAVDALLACEADPQLVREALELYRSRGKPKPRDLLKYAKICRVEKIMRPYLDALL